jgi:hypothetical protein
MGGERKPRKGVAEKMAAAAVVGPVMGEVGGGEVGTPGAWPATIGVDVSDGKLTAVLGSKDADGVLTAPEVEALLASNLDAVDIARVAHVACRLLTEIVRGVPAPPRWSGLSQDQQDEAAAYVVASLSGQDADVGDELVNRLFNAIVKALA